MNAASRRSSIAVLRISGAIVAYGCLAAFLVLISVQIYRWFRDGEWPHIGITDGLRAMLTSCCVGEGSTGPLVLLVHWLDAPTDWLGWHKVLEVVPASIGLFSLSVLGNFLFIYGSDRLEDQRSR
jgi:hypothetical protein